MFTSTDELIREFLLYCFDNDDAFTSTRRNFYDDNKGFDLDDKSMFFRRRRTLSTIQGGKAKVRPTYIFDSNI